MYNSYNNTCTVHVYVPTDLLIALSLIIPAWRIPFITQAFSSLIVCSREKARHTIIIIITIHVYTCTCNTETYWVLTVPVLGYPREVVGSY